MTKLSWTHLALAVLLALYCGVLEANVAHRRHKKNTNEIPGVVGDDDLEHRLMIECQNEDYRTYIKCLKREKRQHFEDSGKRNCLSECFDVNCTTSSCIQDCHRRCRTKLIYTKTLETTYDCDNESCKPTVPNITIVIQNNCTNNNSPPCVDPTTQKPPCNGNDTSGCNDAPKINIHNEITNRIEYPPRQDCPCPGYLGCNCLYNNQWQMPMPQITIGFGGMGSYGGGVGGPFGGCMFPWPCLPRYPVQQPQQQQQQQIDCSMCFYIYRCDPACYIGKNETDSSNMTMQRPASWINRRQ